MAATPNVKTRPVVDNNNTPSTVTKSDDVSRDINYNVDDDYNKEVKDRKNAADRHQQALLPQTIQIRDSDPAAKSMFYALKCKHAVYACAGIAVVHLLLVALFSGSNLDTGQVLLPRTARDTHDHEDVFEFNQENVVSSVNSNEHGDVLDAVDKCISGHVQGLPQMCDELGCLKVLERPQQRGSIDITQLKNVSFTGGASSSGDIGFLPPIHVNIIAILTQAQWKNGVYGTVAGIGTHQPIVTFALASQLDVSAGEQLMVSDLFPGATSSSPGGPGSGPASSQEHIDHLTVYVEEKLKINHPNLPSPSSPKSPHLRVHVGSTDELTKGLLRGWNVPQCRLISVEGHPDSTVLVERLRHALCLLHDGGVIVIDGMEGVHEPETLGAVNELLGRLRLESQKNNDEYLDKQGLEFTEDIIVPFFSTKDKLYLCTSKWRRTFMEYIQQEHGSFLASFHVKEVTNARYSNSNKHSYYAVYR